MRKTRIDEFPNLNVLKGDMAVVGPRPERPFVKEISEVMPFYETRHIIKPGLHWLGTGQLFIWCINDSLIKLQYDLYYIKHRSFYLI
jgi:lipopolysaccharide/colanic/teichoic acid biosynthesis glycosyltransferase